MSHLALLPSTYNTLGFVAFISAEVPLGRL
jgi:hypothetical protein